MFLAVIDHLISGIFEDNEEEEPETAPDAETLLYTSGRRYLHSIVHPQSLGLYQLILAESQRFPQISEQFYRAGRCAPHKNWRRAESTAVSPHQRKHYWPLPPVFWKC